MAEVELAWELLAQVPDPELPTVSVVDLGIARDVQYADGARLVVTITPTYSGCPAMREIEHDVRTRLAERFDDVEVRTVLSPPWTTDWITEDGRRKLAGVGHRAARRADAAAARAGPSGRVPALRLRSGRGARRLRLDGVQGALALHVLPRAVRLRQGALDGCHPGLPPVARCRCAP